MSPSHGLPTIQKEHLEGDGCSIHLSQSLVHQILGDLQTFMKPLILVFLPPLQDACV